MLYRVAPTLLCICTLSLAGCAVTAREIPAAGSSLATTGTVHGGQQPVAGATITVWEMGASGYGSSATALASVTTDQSGSFAFPAGAYTCDYANAPVYITAQGGNPGNAGGQTNPNLMLAAGIGSCGNAPNQSVSINEVTTAATAYALGQFFTTTLGGSPGGDSFGAPAAGAGVFRPGLVTANNVTVPALVDLASGTANAGSANMIVDAAKLNTVANILATCVNSTGETSTTETTTLCGRLFGLTTPPGGGARPADTLQAAVVMALYPYQNVAALYELPSGFAPFVGLAAQPNDWTVAIAYKAPAMGLAIDRAGGIPTSSTIDIDAAGRIWFPTNLSGAAGVGFFDPASQSFNGPYATAAVTRPQYVAVDLSGNVWATDQASATVASISVAAPSAAAATYTAVNGGGGGPLVVDADGTVLFASLAAGGHYNLDAIAAGSVSVDNLNAFIGMPTGLAIASAGSAGNHAAVAATASNAQGCAEEFSSTGQGASVFAASGGTCATGGVAMTASGADALYDAASINEVGSANASDFFQPPVPVSKPQAVATDGAGALWIANAGSGSVSMLGYTLGTFSNSDYHTISPAAYVHDASHGNTMPAPYGLAIDQGGNVWVANAGCIATTEALCAPGAFVLTELVGAAAPTVTPLAAQLQTGAGVRPALSGAGRQRSQFVTGRRR